MSTGNSLMGKAALVTGGSRGIGAEIVRRLAAEGADVAFTYNTGKDAAQMVSGQVAGHPGQQRRNHLLGAAGPHAA